MEKQIIMLQHFFEADTRIKKDMLKIAPPDNSGFLDSDSMVKYTDLVEDTLVYIFSELKCIVVDLFGEDSFVLKKVVELEHKIKNNFYNCGLDIHKLRSFYKTCISDMDPDFINLVKDTCKGYSLVTDVSAVNYCKTINEMLHFLHSYVMNNDIILQSVPEILSKENENGELICLRGINDKFFESIFSKFPTDLDVGYTDMVIVDERKMLVMVRDRGHALTIEITLKNDSARMEYFIPKLCDIDMINKLPGVNKVDSNSIGATGVTYVSTDELAESLFDFISKVPTDIDMINKMRAEKQI